MVFKPFYFLLFYLFTIIRFALHLLKDSLVAFQFVLGHDVGVVFAQLVDALGKTFGTGFGRWLVLADDILDECIGFGLVLDCCIAGGFHFGAVVGYLVGHRLSEERVAGECLVIERTELCA